MSDTYPPTPADREVTYSPSTASSQHTAAEPPSSSTKKAPVASGGIFNEPGTLPLPDAGHLHLGVVFEDLTVHGTGGAQRTVEGLEISVMKVLPFLQASFTARSDSLVFLGFRLLQFRQEADWFVAMPGLRNDATADSARPLRLEDGSHSASHQELLWCGPGRRDDACPRTPRCWVLHPLCVRLLTPASHAN